MLAAGDQDNDDTEAPIASVVVPAHDEEAVIGRLLDALARGTAPGRLDVVVACNGCTDDTARVARAHGARVVEVPAASKIAALNAGDDAAATFPRVYVDADIVITGAMVEALAAALDEPGVLCAAPPMVADSTGRPWGVRAFYAVWPAIPYMRDRHVGSGVFALAEAGRARFGRWPDIVNDDLFARVLFTRDERRVVGSEPFVVQAPYSVRSLVKRRTRIHAGNMQAAVHPDLCDLPGRRESSGPWWRAVVDDPRLAPAALPYAAINGVAKVNARRQLKAAGPIAWNRDETTRQAPASAPSGGPR
jgi:glycosyltransferase involved in cell wall biosynthesis